MLNTLKTPLLAHLRWQKKDKVDAPIRTQTNKHMHTHTYPLEHAKPNNQCAKATYNVGAPATGVQSVWQVRASARH